MHFDMHLNSNVVHYNALAQRLLLKEGSGAMAVDAFLDLCAPFETVAPPSLSFLRTRPALCQASYHGANPHASHGSTPYRCGKRASESVGASDRGSNAARAKLNERWRGGSLFAPGRGWLLTVHARANRSGLGVQL